MHSKFFEWFLPNAHEYFLYMQYANWTHPKKCTLALSSLSKCSYYLFRLENALSFDCVIWQWHRCRIHSLHSASSALRHQLRHLDSLSKAFIANANTHCNQMKQTQCSMNYRFVCVYLFSRITLKIPTNCNWSKTNTRTKITSPLSNILKKQKVEFSSFVWMNCVVNIMFVLLFLSLFTSFSYEALNGAISIGKPLAFQLHLRSHVNVIAMAFSIIHRTIMLNEWEEKRRKLSISWRWFVAENEWALALKRFRFFEIQLV